MIYLLDANMLIHADKQYYAPDIVPEYWDWLVYQIAQGRVKIPLAIYEEITVGSDKDSLKIWVKDNKKLFLIDKESDENFHLLLQKVINEGYAPDLNTIELEKIGKDPFLVAYALSDKENFTVVTNEVSASSKKRQNRKIPDICRDFGISCINSLAFNSRLNFKTSWNK